MCTSLDQSDNISMDQSMMGTTDSLQQLRTMAEGQAFPEMQPMMKRFLQESDNQMNMTVGFSKEILSSSGSGTDKDFILLRRRSGCLISTLNSHLPMGATTLVAPTVSGNHFQKRANTSFQSFLRLMIVDKITVKSLSNQCQPGTARFSLPSSSV